MNTCVKCANDFTHCICTAVIQPIETQAQVYLKVKKTITNKVNVGNVWTYKFADGSRCIGEAKLGTAWIWLDNNPSVLE